MTYREALSFMHKSAANGIHTVQSGDTVSGLAKRYNTSVSAFSKANPGLNVNRIYPKQELFIPDVQTKAAPKVPAAKPAAVAHAAKPAYTAPAAGGLYADPTDRPTSYVVQKGDTYEAIGKRFGTSVSRLGGANRGINPNKLRIGAKLTLPSSDRQNIVSTYGIDPEAFTPLADNIVNAIGQVESTGGLYTHNAKTDAAGTYQITPSAYNEALRVDPSLATYTLDDRYDEQKSRTMMNTLMRKWSRDFAYRKGRYPTNEELVQMWHAGPTNYTGKQALDYRKKVYGAIT